MVLAGSNVDPVRRNQRFRRSVPIRFTAFACDDLETATARWLLAASENVGDISTMLLIAVAIGFGLTKMMAHIVTAEQLRHYVVLTALGGSGRRLWSTVFAQAGIAGLLAAGVGIGIGAYALAATVAGWAELPYRMAWPTRIGCAMRDALACAARRW